MPERMDTIALKQQLADALGESGKEYWKKLGEYLQGTCEKDELDEVAKSVVINPTQIQLHNNFLLAIFHNIHPNVPRPQGPADGEYVVKTNFVYKSKRKSLGPNPAQLKKKFLTRAIYTLQKEDRNRILSIVPRKPGYSELSFKKNLFPNGFPKGVDSIPKSCVEEGDLPNHDMLRERIRFISAIQGLGGQPSNEVVELVSISLENYMKKLISRIKTVKSIDYTHKRQWSSESGWRNAVGLETINSMLGLHPVVHPDLHEKVNILQ